VNLYDEIDFICPHYPPPASASATDNQVDAIVDDVSRSLEYYVVYQVGAFIGRRGDSRETRGNYQHVALVGHSASTPAAIRWFGERR